MDKLTYPNFIRTLQVSSLSATGARAPGRAPVARQVSGSDHSLFRADLSEGKSWKH
ncbi:hypothetical protein SHLA_26c000520 [Shinella sp. DD12]|nr:hypothetical protein SHLA_26c000520 [Shinella sp. DD12]